jgi:hypothetical protein
MLRLLTFVLWFFFLPVIASAGVSVAVFPFQELGEGRQGVNFQLSNAVAQLLTEDGTEIISPETVVSFMVSNRIRTVGYLERYQIANARRDLGAPFVLLGTVFERDKRSAPSIGLVLSLVRTSDARTIWTYVGSFSAARERTVLAIGEAQTSDELQPLLLLDIVEKWPSQVISNEQLVRPINFDSIELGPQMVRPGGEVHCRVRLRDAWPAGKAPRIFFKVADQLYPASPNMDDGALEGVWVAAEENGRYPVALLLEWPDFDRTETVLLGYYLVDGVLPLFELDLRGDGYIKGRPVYYNGMRIYTNMLVHKPLSRWHLSIYSEESAEISAELSGEGNLPESFFWNGKDKPPEGGYRITVEVWDEAGNSAEVSAEALLITQRARVGLNLKTKGNEIVVNVEDVGRVPLSYWRLEMWTKEGRIITETEGEDLPATFDVKVPETEYPQEIAGFLFYSDVMGRQVRRKVENLLPKLEAEKKEAVKEKSSGISERWVNDF